MYPSNLPFTPPSLYFRLVIYEQSESEKHFERVHLESTISKARGQIFLAFLTSLPSLILRNGSDAHLKLYPAKSHAKSHLLLYEGFSSSAPLPSDPLSGQPHLHLQISSNLPLRSSLRLLSIFLDFLSQVSISSFILISPSCKPTTFPTSS